MRIAKKDIKKILEILENFPEVSELTQIKLDYYCGSIGNSLNLIIPIDHNGVIGEFTTEIFGTEDW
jgi:hypothetical protein